MVVVVVVVAGRAVGAVGESVAALPAVAAAVVAGPAVGESVAAAVGAHQEAVAAAVGLAVEDLLLEAVERWEEGRLAGMLVRAVAEARGARGTLDRRIALATIP